MYDVVITSKWRDTLTRENECLKKLMTSFHAQNVWKVAQEVCAKFGFVWIKGGKVMLGADQMGSEGVFKVPV